MLAGYYSKAIRGEIKVTQNVIFAPLGINRKIVDYLWSIVFAEQIFERNGVDRVGSSILSSLEPCMSDELKESICGVLTAVCASLNDKVNARIAPHAFSFNTIDDRFCAQNLCAIREQARQESPVQA